MHLYTWASNSLWIFNSSSQTKHNSIPYICCTWCTSNPARLNFVHWPCSTNSATPNHLSGPTMNVLPICLGVASPDQNLKMPTEAELMNNSDIGNWCVDLCTNPLKWSHHDVGHYEEPTQILLLNVPILKALDKSFHLSSSGLHVYCLTHLTYLN